MKMKRVSPTYTIAVCNYNMAETIGEVSKSILKQIDTRFELLVIDDASTDRSLEILDQLAEENNNMRYKSLDLDPNRNLGETRNISIREARGEYVLPQLDADDRYDRREGGIIEFVKLFHAIEAEISYDFYLKGRNINIGKRDFLLERGPYRNLPVGAEDLDLWRRLHAEGRLICINHEKIHKPDIGYEKTLFDRIRRSYRIKLGNFQTGIPFLEQLRWNFERSSKSKIGYHLLSTTIAYLHARTKEQYPTPEDCKDLVSVHRQIEREQQQTVSDIEEKYDLKIDPDVFSDLGREMFYAHLNES